MKEYMKPEVAVAVAVTAAVSSPRIRGMLRRGAIYGMAGALMAGDALASAARSATRAAQKATASAEGKSQQATEQATVGTRDDRTTQSAEEADG